ncbi:hypothetical protein GJAV_G00187540 [Gymnothorax javanicus]|nr:hypothetical protein GJAV_G00187540 [Gymnothorax javanicus]
MSEWKKISDGCRVIPPHNQSVRLAEELPPAGFQITLKHLIGGPIVQREHQGPLGPRFQLRVSLFDVGHRHFFGGTWRSPLLQQTRTGLGQTSRVPFNEVLYFHTRIRLPAIVAVVEVVSVVEKEDCSQNAVGCGFGILRLFPRAGSPEEPRGGLADGRLNLYHGSPRALLFQPLQEPIEQNTLMTPIEGTYLQFSLKPHPALEAAAHLLPPNTLVSGAQSIPGILPPTGDSVDSLLKPRLMKSFTCCLEQLFLSLSPSLERFEEGLLQLLSTDHSQQKGWPLESCSVCVQERRLLVGLHNGVCFVRKPQVLLLESEPLSKGGGGGSRASLPPPRVLALRGRLELREVVKHPAFAIVFQLEYVFSAPVSPEPKMAVVSSLSRAAYMQCLGWAVWCPFRDEGNMAAEATVTLQGGGVPGPAGVMVYAGPTPDCSAGQVTDLERGEVKFRFSVRSESQPPSPAPSLRTSRTRETSLRNKSPSPSRGERQPTARALPPESPQGPGLSISQLAASPRYPIISHSSSSPWQQRLPSQLHPSPLLSANQLSHIEMPCASSIAHLEAGLSQGDPTPAEPLRELPFTPVHAPVTALGTQTSGACSSSSLSRSSMAQLFSAGFPEILDLNGQAAEVLDPAEPVNFNPQREEADLLQCNELVLQFLAFSRVTLDGVSEGWPSSVYFTLQLYRFPPVTTQRMLLLSPEKADTRARGPHPCVLALVNKDGAVEAGSPGLQLRYLVDPGFLKQGEQRWFLRYLALHTLQIDVWDSASLLLVGSAAVELKHLLRQGRPAVQVTQELEVVTTEYLQDAPQAGGNLRNVAAMAAVSAFTTVKGRLHLRLGNIGRPADANAKRPEALPPARSRVIAANDGTSGFKGGSIHANSVSSMNVRKAARARRLAEMDGELALLLHGRAKEVGVAVGRGLQEGEETRRRKLERMAVVRQYEEQGLSDAPARPGITSRREEHIQHLRDLRLIEAYRERSKAGCIANMLAQAITTRHTLYATLGTAEFFEFQLKNPFNVQQTVTIESDDPELSVIVNCGEWRHFKSLTNTATPLEEDMFHLREDSRALQIYLRPKEAVFVPLKYQTFTAETAATVAQGPAMTSSGRNANLTQKHQSNTIPAKTIKVSFMAEDGKPLAICQVDVEPTPHVIDQTFRFYHPELTFLKKAIRLPPWDVLPGASARGSSTSPVIHVRSSDPNIICDSRRVSPSEPQDVFLKVAGGPSPQIKKFFIMVFTDEWLAAPAQIWQVYVHFLQRVDISCVTGQLTWQSLVLRGSHALQRSVLLLPPGRDPDRPTRSFCSAPKCRAGPPDRGAPAKGWLQPLISKAFEISLPVGGGRGSNKKITYTNPYPNSRVFLLSSDHPDLLQFKEDSFQIGGGETYTIGLRFAPSQSAGTEEILVFINDCEDKNEETFCIKVQYQ